MLPPRLPESGAHWVDHVARHAHAIPDQAAIRFEGASITWARLHERVQRLAAAFAGRGVSQGDRVAILMTNRPEFVEAMLAANAAGAIAVPVNFRLAPAEAAYVLARQRRPPRRHRRRCSPRSPRRPRPSLPQPPRIIVTGLDTAGGTAAGAESYEALLEARHGRAAGGPDRRARRRADHVHLGHHGPAEGRHADPPEPAHAGHHRDPHLAPARRRPCRAAQRAAVPHRRHRDHAALADDRQHVGHHAHGAVRRRRHAGRHRGRGRHRSCSWCRRNGRSCAPIPTPPAGPGRCAPSPGAPRPPR